MQPVYVIYYSDHCAYPANFEDGWVTIKGVYFSRELAEKEFAKLSEKDPGYYFMQATVLDSGSANEDLPIHS
jgi:hypothetical protein